MLSPASMRTCTASGRKLLQPFACAHACPGLEHLARSQDSAVADRPHKLSIASWLDSKNESHQHAD